jgi:hypothetical protein
MNETNFQYLNRAMMQNALKEEMDKFVGGM